MTFEEFLAYIRETIGFYCKDEYWLAAYNNLADKSKEAVDKKLSFWAMNAIATDYTYRRG